MGSASSSLLRKTPGMEEVTKIPESSDQRPMANVSARDQITSHEPVDTLNFSKTVAELTLQTFESAAPFPHVHKDGISADVMATVRKCWKDVNLRCSRAHPFASKPREYEQLPGWKTVRVFVSSTFRDFHDEREILVKKAFPELNEWCEGKKIELIDCDLRWGVPKDTTSVDTILTCLHEIERCYEETGGEPFFIGLVGDRYGWVPTEDDLTEQLIGEYEWVLQSSITFMEFLLGAIWPCSKNAVFFIRDSGYVNSLPSSQRSVFTESLELPYHQLQVLKDELYLRFSRLQVIPYFVTVECTEPEEKVVLKGLDFFALSVVNFMKTAIEKKYPHQAEVAQLDEDQLEDDLQSTYIHKQAEKYDFKRDTELSALTDYVDGRLQETNEAAGVLKHESDAEYLSSQEFEKWHSLCGVEPTWRPHMFVRAEDFCYLPGALLAQLAIHLKTDQKKGDVFTFFEQSVPSWQNVRAFLKRLSTFLDCTAIPDDWVENQTAYQELVADLVRHMETTKRNITFILSVNEVGSFMSNWFPPALPNGSCCIVTSSQLPENTARAWKSFGCYELCVKPLTTETAESYISRFFHKFNKRLDKEQMLLLLSNEGSSVPLWLASVCEDLRRFGEFRLVTKRICSYPPKLVDLLSQMLIQLVREDETACLKKALCILLCCSASGVRQADMLKLLQLGDPGELATKDDGVVKQPHFSGENATPGPLSKLAWAKIYRNIKSFLYTWYSYENSERHETYKLGSPALSKTIRMAFLADEASLKAWRLQVGSYYESQHCRTSTRHSFDESALQYHTAGANDSLLQLCRRSRLTEYRPRRDYMQRMRCWMQVPTGAMSGSFPGGTEVNLCTGCSVRSGAFSGLPHRNSDSCAICGALVFSIASPGTADRAMLCVHHSISRHPNTCFLCPVPLPRGGNVAHMVTKMRLCHMCNFPPAARCCLIVV